MKNIIFIIIFTCLIPLSVNGKDVKLGVNYTYSYMPLGWGIEKEFPAVAKKLGLGDVSLKLENFKNSNIGFDLLLSDQLDIIVASPTLVNNYELKESNVVRFLVPMNSHNMALTCRNEYKTLEDIKKNPPIVAVPGRNVTNHMVLKWIGETHLGNQNFFEDRMIVLTTQQMQQLVASNSKDLDCVVWGSPIQNQLQEQGMNKIIETDDVKYFPGSINMFVVKKKWADANPKLAEAFVETVRIVNQKYNENPYPFLKMYVEKSNINIDPTKMTKWYKDSNTKGATDVPVGLDNNLRFAQRVGFIDKLSYKKIEDLFWNTAILDK